VSTIAANSPALDPVFSMTFRPPRPRYWLSVNAITAALNRPERKKSPPPGRARGIHQKATINTNFKSLSLDEKRL
jgi:hypothetical protein